MGGGIPVHGRSARELPLSAERVLAALQGRAPEVKMDVEALRRTEGQR